MHASVNAHRTSSWRHAVWAAAFAAVSSDGAFAADDAHVNAQIAPRAEVAPSLPRLPGDELPAFHCDHDYCGFDALKDLWRRGLPGSAPSNPGNADTILLERTQFAAEAKRWADTPPVFQVALPGTRCVLGGDVMGDGEGFGLRCGDPHRDKDPRFYCIDPKTCTPTMER